MPDAPSTDFEVIGPGHEPGFVVVVEYRSPSL
jgi:hypothetical protein